MSSEKSDAGRPKGAKAASSNTQEDPRSTSLVFGIAVPADGDEAHGTKRAPVTEAVDPLGSKKVAIDAARRAAGIAPETLPLWTPEEWIRLDFPYADEGAAEAFVEAAFLHRGWPLVAGFRADFDAAYAGLPSFLKRQAAPSATKAKEAAAQIRMAMRTLRPRVVASLERLETVAVAVLGERVATAVKQARSQAIDLIMMPRYAGKEVEPAVLLDARAANSGPVAIRNAPTPLQQNEKARRCREFVNRLEPTATKYARANLSRNVQTALKAVKTTLKVHLALVAAVPPKVGSDAVDAAAVELEQALAEGKLGDALAATVREHRAALESWAECRETFIAARRAFASEFPVLHRFGFNDVVAAAKDDDVALGERIVRKLAAIHSGATQVQRSHVAGQAGSRIQPKRPARVLAKAMRSDHPPDDPVAYLIELAEGSVWQHPALIQDAVRAIVEQPGLGGSGSILDDFDASVSVQALAEFSRAQQRAMFKSAVEAVGITAGMIALHFIAPPLAFAADATLAAGDLSSGISGFGADSALARCAFDPALALGEEPSLAWFLASQAFSVLTVG